MSFFVSLLSCCGDPNTTTNPRSRTNANSKSESSSEEVRNARVRCVRRFDDGSWTEARISGEPPRYEDVFSGAMGRESFVRDEKDPGIYDVVTAVGGEEEQDQRQDQQPVTAIEIQRSLTPTLSGSDGDGSSVVSVPSTRLSGLTSSYTGATNRTSARLGDERTGENRFSFAGSRASYMDFGDGSAPPSYYAESVGRDGEAAADEGEGHPVLSEGWLERLRVHAERSVREGRQG